MQESRAKVTKRTHTHTFRVERNLKDSFGLSRFESGVSAKSRRPQWQVCYIVGYARFRPPKGYQRHQRPFRVAHPSSPCFALVLICHMTHDASWSTPAWQWSGTALGLDLVCSPTWVCPYPAPALLLLQSVLGHLAQALPQYPTSTCLCILVTIVVSRLTV